MFSLSEIFISGIVAFLICCACVPVFSSRAEYLGLIDRPGGRKQHSGAVPIVGGLSVYLSVVLSGAILGFNAAFFLPLVLGFPILISGLIDDRQSLSPVARMPIQIISAMAMVYVGQVEINSIGNIIGASSPILLVGFGALFFTILCTVGVINAVNMVDGVDGLSGSLIVLILLPLTMYAWISHDLASVGLLVSLVAAILAFLLFNSRLCRSHATVFLGDAGSTFLGFVVVWHLIKYTQGEYFVLSPVSAGWILGVPLMDTVSVMMRRLFNKRSPLQADRTHLHHRLLDAGLGANKTVIVILGFQALFITIGVVGNLFSGADFMLFWIFVVATVLHFFLTHRAITRLFVIKSFRKILVEPSSERAVQ